MTLLVDDRKFQTGPLRLHFWEREKLQLDQALNLGLVSWALAEMTSFEAHGFLIMLSFKEKWYVKFWNN